MRTEAGGIDLQDPVQPPQVLVFRRRRHAHAADTIFAPAPVTAMRRRHSIMIPLGFWIIAVNRSFEIGCAERISGAFDLRQIDGDSFPRPAAV